MVWLSVSYILEIKQIQILRFYIKTTLFEANFMVQSSSSKVFRMAFSLSSFLIRSKMANAMLAILDSFSLVWRTGIQSSRFDKWLQILNLSKWIVVVDISAKILLTLLIFIDLPILRENINLLKMVSLWFELLCRLSTLWRVING